MIKAVLSRIVIFFLFLVSLLPFWFLYLISDVIYVLLFYIIRYRRHVVQDNLRNSFPEKTIAELQSIEKKYFHYLGDLMVETVKMISISEKEVKRRMIYTNVALFDEYYKQGRTIVAVIGHYCNWEISAHRCSFVPSYKKVYVFKPLSNKVADSYYQKIRGRFGALLVPMRSIFRRLVELRKELTLTVLISDQTPVQGESQYYTTFLNQPTAVFLGVEKMAIAFNSVVIFGDIRRVKRGYYEMDLVPLVENPKETAPHEITELHVKYLEQMILREPQYWLWSHRRWKFKPEGVLK